MSIMPTGHGDLVEEVYISFQLQDSNGLALVCRLHKAIYGLKQAPRAWFECLSVSSLSLFVSLHQFQIIVCL